MILAKLLSDPTTSDLWHDPAFQFIVNAIIAILAIIVASIVSIGIYRRQQNRKEITCQVISDASVVTVDKALEHRIDIIIDEKSVRNVTLAIIRVENTGNVAVDDEDYKEQLTITFNNRKVISSEVIETNPKDLIDDPARKTFIPVPAPEQDFIEFPKFLLNAAQSVTFSVLLDGAKDEIRKKGRIIDGQIAEYIEPKVAPTWVTWSLFAVSIIVAMMVGAVSFLATEGQMLFALVLGIIVYLVIFVISTLVLNWLLRSRTR
jgi:hypothetical protein